MMGCCTSEHSQSHGKYLVLLPKLSAATGWIQEKHFLTTFFTLLFVLYPANLPCDSVVGQFPGSYYSPYYPDTYLNDQTCRTHFVIPDPSDNRVPVIIIDDFNLEKSTNCSRDSLTIYDGDNITKPVLGAYCGTEIPVYITPSGLNATVVFHTDSNVTSSGYKLRVLLRIGMLKLIRNNYCWSL